MWTLPELEVGHGLQEGRPLLRQLLMQSLEPSTPYFTAVQHVTLRLNALTCYYTLVDMSNMISISSLLIQMFMLYSKPVYLEVRAEEIPTATAVKNFLRPAGQHTTTTIRTDLARLVESYSGVDSNCRVLQ